MKYKPVVYSEWGPELPELDWEVSLSVDQFNFSDTTTHRVFWQVEPPVVSGKEDIIPKLLANWQFYDLILAWDITVLNECPNARLFPMGGVWCRESDTSEKKFAASFLTSWKTSDVMSKAEWLAANANHRNYDRRQILFDSLSESVASIPITKHKSPPYLPSKRSMLVPFQYHIVMENFLAFNWFTEKVNDAFATKTIPIYCGAPNIEKFYDPEGILTFDGSIKSLTEVLEKLTPEHYESKQAAIEKNFTKALKYENTAGNVAWAIIFDAWLKADGDNTFLLDYPDINGVVLDIGGYKGAWTARILPRLGAGARLYVFEPVLEFCEELREKFKHDERVTVVPVALSNHTGTTMMSKDTDCSSLHVGTMGERVDLLDVAEFFERENLGNVDLVNMNIEGHEFTLLPRMVETGVIRKCQNIQIKFHSFYPQAAALRDEIRGNLARTHTGSFNYPFVWEGWERT